MPRRREILKGLGLGAATALLPAASFARAESNATLVLVVLRGAVDGLALVPPYGEGKYRGLRGELALAAPGTSEGVLKLDGLFGLHPAMQNCYSFYRDQQAIIVHAVASPYRERSHFDGQDVLENGATSSCGKRDGWLNRAVEPLGGSFGNEIAIALSQNTPLILRGDNSVTSWAPSRLEGVNQDTLRRIEAMYAGEEFFSTRLAQALESQDIAADMAGMAAGRRGGQGAQLKSTLESAARFLTAPNGPRIAVVEAGGWDTHANQGADRGSLANKFRDLDEGIAGLRSALGNRWASTVVAVVTEFGRTVRVNGTRGTDHGTATAALLLGGAIDGGRVVADWPGLNSTSLYEGRDLYPTTDIRSVFKGILSEHFELTESTLNETVFPDSAPAPSLRGLIRA
jgi:uncharacterized protein (DUF1501 family)